MCTYKSIYTAKPPVRHDVQQTLMGCRSTINILGSILISAHIARDETTGGEIADRVSTANLRLSDRQGRIQSESSHILKKMADRDKYREVSMFTLANSYMEVLIHCDSG